jgi:hypothetical protein
MINIRIENILTKKQIKEVTDYINKQAKAGYRVTDTQVITGLKEILHKWQDELVIKDIDSDFLAYAIVYESSKRQVPR